MRESYTYSQLASACAASMVGQYYDVPKNSRCKFYVLGLHDNYLIEADGQRYILRIYRNDWRSVEEVYFEIELLSYLGLKNQPIAAPVLTRAGELCFFIDSPEGKRAAALFAYADGHAPGNDISPDSAASLGKAVAYIHQQSEGFETSHARQVLDIPYLLDESVHAIGSFVGQGERNYLRTLQTTLNDTLSSLSTEGDAYGICIGDVNLSNFHVNDNGEITLFDFDQCGYGYRAFEIGKFISSIHSLKNKHDISREFVAAYQQVRPLSQEEIMTIPYFEIISVIWVMAIHVYNADRVGYKFLEKPFWDRRFAILKDLDKPPLWQN